MNRAHISWAINQTSRASRSRNVMLLLALIACFLGGTLAPLTAAFAYSNTVSVKTAETNQAATAENIARVSKGMAIYQYYLGNDFAALTQLAINDKKKLVKHSDNSKLFKVGLQLHFQMDTAAGNIFAPQLLQQAHTSSNLPYRDLVYFNFAKALYKKQHYQYAKQAIAHMGNNLAAEHQDDYHFLNAQLLLKLGDIVGASAAQQQISAASLYHRYLAFNQAMLSIANKQTEQAISALAKVTNLQPVVLSNADEEQAIIAVEISDELEALLDRANLAMAYLSLEQGQNRQAIDAFKRIRIDGIDSDAAMLGYGWAAANSHDYQTALMVWQQLSSHQLFTPYVLEAYVAIGYAYEQMHDIKSAYTAYHLAIAKFNQQQQLLDIELAKIYGSATANKYNKTASKANNDYILSLLRPVTDTLTSTTAELNNKLPAGFIDAKVELVLPPAINSFAVVASNEFQQRLDDLNQVTASITKLNAWQQQLRLSPVADMQDKVANTMAAASRLQQLLLSNLQTRLAASLAEQRTDLATFMEKAKVAIVRLSDEVFIKQRQMSEQTQPLRPNAEQPRKQGKGES